MIKRRRRKCFCWYAATLLRSGAIPFLTPVLRGGAARLSIYIILFRQFGICPFSFVFFFFLCNNWLIHPECYFKGVRKRGKHVRNRTPWAENYEELIKTGLVKMMATFLGKKLTRAQWTERTTLGCRRRGKKWLPEIWGVFSTLQGKGFFFGMWNCEKKVIHLSTTGHTSLF